MRSDGGTDTWRPPPFHPGAREADEPLAAPSVALVIGSIVFAAVALNFALASINANLVPLNRSHVVLAEVLIVGSAAIICARFANTLMVPWATVLWVIVLLFVTLSIFRQSVEIKYLRDVVLIPVFIALGMVYKGNILRLFFVLQIFILSVMVLEGLSPALFGSIANPFQYYINTRDYTEDRFWVEGSLLFVSSIRVEGRFFDWLNIHRLSSIFLEPVSLGNWCIIITLFIATFWRSLSRRMLFFLAVSNIVILIGSDGRLAASTSLAILLVAAISPWLPRFSYVLYLPIATAAAVALVAIFDPTTYGGFLGRVHYSVDMLSSIDTSGISGLDTALMERSYDSGIAYFILSQSIIGVAVLWLAICLLQPAVSRSSTVFIHGVCLYIALSLMVSYSMFSIKTAAPLWFLYGYVRARHASTS